MLTYYVRTNKIVKKGPKFCRKSIVEYLDTFNVMDLDGEIWKPVPKFEKYMASNLGRIKSLNFANGRHERLMTPAVSGGYYKTMLSDSTNKERSIKVHRIICSTFSPNINSENLEVNHINGIKTDNSSVNLEWVTRQENIKHCVENNLQIPFKGEQVGTHKLKEWQVLDIRAKYNTGFYKQAELAREYKVAKSTIRVIVLRTRWKHI